jgi:2-polyprenyl-3-methyl-5-hydroxy-6-metoxy-1,4-benzoquinol methylase
MNAHVRGDFEAAGAIRAPCPVCGGAGALYAVARDTEYFTSDRSFAYAHCASCDVLYVDPMLKDRLGEIYPPNYYSFQAADGRTAVTAVKEWLDARAFRALLRSIPGEGLATLDVGGGTGNLSSLMRKIDRRVIRTQIVDIDPAAKAAAEGAGHGYFCGGFEDFDATDRYDVILMLNLIEHVADPVGMLAKARSLMSKRGLLYIKTPNFRSLDARLFRHRNWGGYHCPRHFVLFNKASFVAACTRAGLAVVEFGYTQGAPFWTHSLLNLLREHGLVTISAERPGIYHPLTPVLQIATAAFDFARKPFAPLSQMIVTLRATG